MRLVLDLPSARRVCAAVLAAALASPLVSACSSTGARAPFSSTDAGRPRDAGPRPRRGPDAGVPERDASAVDGGSPDGGSPDRECFPEVRVFTSANRSRANFLPHALLAHDRGWVAVFSWSDGVAAFGESAALIDRRGQLRRVQPFELGRTWRHLVVGRFVVSWGTWGFHTIRVHQILGTGLIEVEDPLPPGHVAHIESVVLGPGRTLRVLSTEASGTATHLRYAELTLGDDGRFEALSGALPELPTLTEANRRFGGLPEPTYDGDLLWFVYPTYEDPFSADGQPWRVVRAQLEVARSEPFGVTWRIASDLRWENGPTGVYFVLPTLRAVIAARWGARPDGSLWPRTWAEQLSGSLSAPIAQLDRDADITESTRGRVTVTRRGATLGVASAGYFRTFDLPSFEEQDAVPLALAGPVAHTTDEVVELGALRVAPPDAPSEGQLYGLVRCHRLSGAASRP